MPKNRSVPPARETSRATPETLHRSADRAAARSTITLALATLLLAGLGCATAPSPTMPRESTAVAVDEPESVPMRSESAAPEGGAACGDRTCGVDEVCVPQGFCSGVRLPTPEERHVTYECVSIPHACAESPSCGCVGDVCRYGSCASISRGVITCICA